MAERQERRSIADAMQVTPEAMAFIKGSGTKTVELKPKTAAKPVVPEIATPMEEGGSDEAVLEAASTNNDRKATTSERRRSYRSNPSKEAPQTNVNFGYGMANLLVPLTTRLQPATATALKRAGLEQKLRGQNPSTVQEIAEIAIQGWLKQNGFL